MPPNTKLLLAKLQITVLITSLSSFKRIVEYVQICIYFVYVSFFVYDCFYILFLIRQGSEHRAYLF